MANEKDDLVAIERKLAIQGERQKVMDANFEKLTSMIERLVKHMDQQEVRNENNSDIDDKFQKIKDEVILVNQKLALTESETGRISKIMNTISIAVVGMILTKVAEVIFNNGA